MRNLPIVLILYSVFCLAFWGSDFLIDNYDTLYIIDSFVFLTSIIHYVVVRGFKYTKTQNICLIGCLAFLFFDRTDIVFNFENNTYFWIYLIIDLIVLGFVIKVNLNEDFKRYS